MRRYAYVLTINGTTWDVTRIADSSTLQIVHPLCSEAKLSGNGTASVNLKGGADPVFYKSLMMAFLSAQQTKTVGDLLLTISDVDSNTVIFRGYLDMDSTEISSKFFPDALTLSARDKMQFLDTKIRYNKLWENESRNQIVEDLIDAMNSDTGVTVSYLSTELTDSSVIGNFAVAEGKEQTYREVIDMILTEAVGFVLWYDPSADGFRIKKIPVAYDPLQTYREVKYLVSNGLTTRNQVYEHDGILLSYPTITVRPNTNLFNEGISRSLDDDGNYIGDQVPSGEYYPFDGDVKEIYQEYSVADRDFVAGVSRLENEDLKLLYAKDVSYQLSSKPMLTLAPSIPQVNWDSTPKYYPDRARILFRNGNSITSNVTVFSITGTAVYVSALNKMTVPSACANPEEYEVQTITDADEAKAFADWLYNSRRYGCTISKWSEPEGFSTLGEIVMVTHKETGVQMPHVIVQLTDVCAGGQSGKIRKTDVVAVSLYGWQQYISQTVPKSVTRSAREQTNIRFLNGTVLTGQTTARGVQGNVGDYYLNDDTGDLYKCIEAGDANHALWVWVMNLNGKDAEITGVTYETEYGLSDSPVEFNFPESTLGDSTDDYGAIDDDDDDEFDYGFIDVAGWSGDYSKWVKGLYVWQRLKVTDSNGNITYTDPTYCKEITDSLISGCAFTVVLTDNDGNGDTQTWDKNLADATNDVTIQFRVIARAYGAVADFTTALTSVQVIPFKNSVSLTPFQPVPPVSVTIDATTGFATAIYNYTFKRNLDYDSLVINATLTDAYLNENGTSYNVVSKASETMTSVDTTEYFAYGGVLPNVNNDDAEANAYFTANYGGLLVGFNYVDSTHNTIRYYDGADWEVLDIDTVKDSGRILSSVEKDFWTLFENIPADQRTNLWDMYGYKRTILASTIATSKLIMYGEGIIASKDISPDPSQDIDENGFLIPTGYRLEGEGGIIRSSGSKFNNAEAQSLKVFQILDLQNAQISHPAISTFEGAIGDSTGRGDTAFNAWNTGVLFNDTTHLPVFTSGNLDMAFAVTYDNGLAVDGIIAKRSSGTRIMSAQMYADHLTGSPSSFTFKILATQNSSPQIQTYVLSVNSGSVQIASGASITISVNGASNTGSIFTTGTITSVASLAWTSFNPSIWTENSTVTVTLTGVTVQSGSANLYVYHYADFSSTVGLYMHMQNGTWVNIGSSSDYPSSVRFDFTLNSYNMLVGQQTIPSPFSFDSLGNLLFCYPTQIGSYNSYTYVDPDDHQTKTVNLSINVPYKASGKVVDAYGHAYDVLFLTVLSLTEVSLKLSDGITQFDAIFNTSQAQPYISTQNVKVSDVEAGVEMMGQYPKTADTYDVGTSTKHWDRGYFNYIHGTLVGGSSLRSMKENITPFERNALGIINSIAVMRYNFIGDRDKTPLIGFIADDTDEDVAGKNHDSFLNVNCIGVLIKAVQELSAEIERLKGGKKS